MSTATEEREALRAAPSEEAADRMATKRANPQMVKASFNLPIDELEALKALARRRQTTATQVVRQALSTELYIQGLVDQGADIMAKVGRRAREIVFAHMRLG